MKRATLLLASGLVLAAAGASADPIEVRIASHVSDLAPLHAQSLMFAAMVEERLPGQFDFQIFPNGQLGRENALIDNVQLGSLEMINVASGVLKIDGRLGLFDLPWLFDNREHVIRVMEDGGLAEEVATMIEDLTGTVVVGIYENGFRHVINSTRPIVEPADMEGLKIRVSGGEFRQNVFASLGAIPTSVSWAETFTAMQTGVVDGAEAAIYGFYEQHHHEVQDYLSLTSHVYTPSFLIASRDFWDSLSEEQQQVFREVGEAITLDAYASAAELEAQYLQEMQAADIAVNEVDLAAFQAATRDVYAGYIADYGTTWLDLVEAGRQ